MSGAKKRLEFQLKASNATKKAQAALDYAILSGKPSKVSDFEVLVKLAEMLVADKFSGLNSGYNIVFFRDELRTNGKIERIEVGLDELKLALSEGIELRPTK